MQQNKVLQLPIQLFLTWNITYRMGRSLHANSAKKLHNREKTPQTLKQPHTLGIQLSYPKCIPGNRRVSGKLHHTQLDTNPPPFEGYTKLSMTGIILSTKTQTSPPPPHPPPPPWNLI